MKRVCTILTLLIITTGLLNLRAAPVSLRNDSLIQEFSTDVSNQLSQEDREGTRSVYDFSFMNDNLIIDVDKAAGSTNEDTLGTGAYNSYNFTQLFYLFSEDTSEVSDLSSYPFVTIRLKSTVANQALFRLFSTSGSHKTNGVVVNTHEYDIPADEWVVITLDYSEMFAYERSGTMYYPDSAEIYQVGIVFGNTDSQGDLLQCVVEVDYIKTGKAAVVKYSDYTEDFASSESLNLLSQEDRAITRDVYEFSQSGDTLYIDVDKAAGSTNEDTLGTGSYNGYNFTQMFYNISENGNEVVDLSEKPFISVRLKSSTANQALFRLFSTSGSHRTNGVVVNTNTYDIPADEWVTINLDYTDMFAYERSGTMYYPDSSSLYRLGIVFGNEDSQSNLLQANVAIDYIKFGKASVVKNPIILQDFISSDALNLLSQEDRAINRDVYLFTWSGDTLHIDVDKAAGSTNEDTLGTGAYNGYNFTQMFYDISENGSVVSDLSENPFVSLRLKSSAANQALFRLFSTSGSHRSNGVVVNTNTYDIPADEWVTINLDYTDMFAYERSGTMYYPDSSSIYRLGIVFGNDDSQGNLLQSEVLVDFIQFGDVVATKDNDIIEEFTSEDALNLFSQEDRAITRDVYLFSHSGDTLMIDVDKAGGSTNEDTLGTGAYNGYNFTQMFYQISDNETKVADLSEYPYVELRLKSSVENSALFRLFSTSGSHRSNGVVVNTNTYDIPADEWVTINLDYTDMFAYERSGTMYYPDSSSIYQMGIVFGNDDTQGDLLQSMIEVDYIKFGKSAESTLSTNSYLSSIMIDGVALEGFNKETYTYTYEVAEGASVPIVTVTEEDDAATSVVTDASAVPGVASIEVTAEDGTTSTYSISFEIIVSAFQDELSTLTVYPNPANDVINISSEIEISNVEIFDITGRARNVEASSNTELYIKELQKGVYIVHIDFINGQTEIRSFIKK